MHSPTTESGADADARFAERLLRGGVAPRHVRRSLRELHDHLSDIKQQLEQEGSHPLDAMQEAQALLGHRDALAEQILARPELRSKARRFAWLLFGVMPIFATIMLSVTVFFAALAASGFVPDPAVQSSLPSSDTPFFAHILTRWVTPLFIAMILSAFALRRRFPPLWPVIGIVLTALIAAGTRIEVHEVSVGLAFEGGRALALVCGLLAVYALGSISFRSKRSIS